nr:hypothetical protein HmN_000794100 [Hymenolepis microstoma]
MVPEDDQKGSINDAIEVDDIQYYFALEYITGIPNLHLGIRLRFDCFNYMRPFFICEVISIGKRTLIFKLINLFELLHKYEEMPFRIFALFLRLLFCDEIRERLMNQGECLVLLVHSTVLAVNRSLVNPTRYLIPPVPHEPDCPFNPSFLLLLTPLVHFQLTNTHLSDLLLGLFIQESLVYPVSIKILQLDISPLKPHLPICPNFLSRQADLITDPSADSTPPPFPLPPSPSSSQLFCRWPLFYYVRLRL